MKRAWDITQLSVEGSRSGTLRRTWRRKPSWGASEIDGRTDLTRLACVAYEALTACRCSQRRRRPGFSSTNVQTQPLPPSHVLPSAHPGGARGAHPAVFEQGSCAPATVGAPFDDELEHIACDAPLDSGQARSWWLRSCTRGGVEERRCAGAELHDSDGEPRRQAIAAAAAAAAVAKLESSPTRDGARRDSSSLGAGGTSPRALGRRLFAYVRSLGGASRGRQDRSS